MVLFLLLVFLIYYSKGTYYVFEMVAYYDCGDFEKSFILACFTRRLWAI